MTRLNTTIIIVAIACVTAMPVFADQDNVQYAWASVVQTDPVIRIIRRPVNEEVCWQEEVYREIPERRSRAPQIFGAILGGIIGNQFGSGSGRDAMTLAGAALGHAIVKDEQRRIYPKKYFAALEDRCGINTEWKETRQIIGWDVTYEYQGVSYLTRMQDEPGDRIRIRIDVQPVQG